MAQQYPLLVLVTAMSFLPTLLLAEEIEDADSNELVYGDSLKIFYRKRNGHACMMSIVFLILYPLGAISLHLPLPHFLRKIRIVPSVHVPIQILGLTIMIGGMGLGIDIATELHFFSTRKVPAHVAVGLLATSMIILIQPAMGILQHWHFRKTGGKSIFGHIHRWNGRVAIILGMINQGLGFQLVGIGTVIEPHSLIRNFAITGLFAGLWLLLVTWDEFRGGLKRNKSVVGNGEKKHDAKGMFSQSPATAEI